MTCTVHVHVVHSTYVHVRMQELAEQEGNVEKLNKLTKQMDDLEERAEKLDKQRTRQLSAIRYSHTCIIMYGCGSLIPILRDKRCGNCIPERVFRQTVLTVIFSMLSITHSNAP